MSDEELIDLNNKAIMDEYCKWVEVTGYIVPPATDAWAAGWQAALDRIGLD